MKPQNIFEAPLPDLVLGGPVRESGSGRVWATPPPRTPKRRSRRKPNPPPSPPPKAALSIDDLIDRKKEGRPKPVRGDYLLTDE